MHAAGEGAVVAAAVLGVEHQAEIQQLGLAVGEFVVLAHGVEEVLGQRHSVLRPVEVEGVAVEIAPLGGVGVGHDHRGAGDEGDGLTQLVLQSHNLGLVIVRIEGQHTAGDLVHHVAGRGLQDHVLSEHGGQGAHLAQQFGELAQLLAVGQAAHEQQERRLLKAEALFGDKAVDQILHVDAAVVELAGHGDLLAVLHVVAHNGADLGQTGHDTGAVGVAQPPLDVRAVILTAADLVVVRVNMSQFRQERLSVLF